MIGLAKESRGEREPKQMLANVFPYSNTASFVDAYGLCLVSHFIVVSGILHVSNILLIRHENKWENVLYFIALLVLVLKQLNVVFYNVFGTEKGSGDEQQTGS